jgi:hypothetical protein
MQLRNFLLNLTLSDLQRMLLFPQIIDFLKQLDIFFHDKRLFLLMTILIFLKIFSQIIQVYFHLLSLLWLFSMDIRLADFIFTLFPWLTGFLLISIHFSFKSTILCQVSFTLLRLLCKNLSVIFLFHDININFVQVHNSPFQLFIVCKIVQTLKNVVPELLFFKLLLSDYTFKLFGFKGKSILS